jgi:hypothetical protein
MSGATIQLRSSLLPAENKNRNAGNNVMTNTSERVTTRLFGLSLTAVFVGLLILNGMSF